MMVKVSREEAAIKQQSAGIKSAAAKNPRFVHDWSTPDNSSWMRKEITKTIYAMDYFETQKIYSLKIIKGAIPHALQVEAFITVVQ